jgi:large subunit ribosomal protein L15
VPKFGFTNPNRVEYKGINLDTLQELIDRKKLKSVTVADLMENGLAGKRDLVKILGRGELKSGVPIQAHKFSATAKAAIEAAGGEAAEA